MQISTLYLMFTLFALTSTNEAMAGILFENEVSEHEKPTISRVAIFDDHIQAGMSTEVEIFVTVSGTLDVNSEFTVTAEISNQGKVEILDDGKGRDIRENDGEYSRLVNVDASSLSHGDRIPVTIKAISQERELASVLIELKVHKYPTNAEPDLSNTIQGPEGITYSANYILMHIMPGTDIKKIEAIAARANTEITKWYPSDNCYVLRLPKTASSYDELSNYVKLLRLEPSVESDRTTMMVVGRLDDS